MYIRETSTVGALIELVKSVANIITTDYFITLSQTLPMSSCGHRSYFVSYFIFSSVVLLFCCCWSFSTGQQSSQGDQQKLWKSLLIKISNQLNNPDAAVSTDELKRLEKIFNSMTMKSKSSSSSNVKQRSRSGGVTNNLLHSLFLLRQVQTKMQNENRRAQQMQMLPALLTKAEEANSDDF